MTNCKILSVLLVLVAVSYADASCSETCFGGNCDYWVNFECQDLEEVYGCACDGCECTGCGAQFASLNEQFYESLQSHGGRIPCKDQQNVMTGLVEAMECYGPSEMKSFDETLAEFCTGDAGSEWSEDWDVDCNFQECKGFSHGSCKNSCGFDSVDCFCDEYCFTYDDCCSDYEDECIEEEEDTTTCFDRCGDAKRGECYCDAYCDDYGDCCDDFEELCYTEDGCYIIDNSDVVDCTFVESFTFIGLGFCRGEDAKDRGTFETFYFDAIEMCGDACLDDSACLGFEWSGEYNSCLIHHAWNPIQTRPADSSECWTRNDKSDNNAVLMVATETSKGVFDITYSTQSVIVGFEIENCQLTDAYGGEADEKFYVDIGPNGIVIGVSLNPEDNFLTGEGNLLTVEGDVSTCSFIISNAEAGGMAYTFDIVPKSTHDDDDDDDDVEVDIRLKATKLSKDVYELQYDSTVSIAGFEVDDCTITDAYGGIAEDVFFIETGVASGIVIAFSFSGNVIEPGSGTLILLEGTVDETCDFVFADKSGNKLTHSFKIME